MSARAYLHLLLRRTSPCLGDRLAAFPSGPSHKGVDGNADDDDADSGDHVDDRVRNTRGFQPTTCARPATKLSVPLLAQAAACALLVGLDCMIADVLEVLVHPKVHRIVLVAAALLGAG